MEAAKKKQEGGENKEEKENPNGMVLNVMNILPGLEQRLGVT